MHKRLVASLAHVAERVAIAAKTQDQSDLVVAKLSPDKRPLSPGLYLLYQDLVQAVVRDDVPAALLLIDEIIEGDWSAQGIRVRKFSSENLGANFYERYGRCLGDDPTTPLSVTAPDDGIAIDNNENIKAAIKLLEASAPDHAEEIKAILSEIILARNVRQDEDAFSGASSFSAWGAIFLCSDNIRDVFDLFCALVHETAHLTLFAEAIEGPLVLNSPEERFVSPLRADRRPMDGIYHATFVSARMHHAVSSLLTTPSFENEKFMEGLPEFGETLADLFNDGYRAVCKDARLTELGESLITEASDYIKENSSVALG